MSRINQILIVFLLLTVLILAFWSPALLPGRALFMRDISIEIIPYRTFWVRSHGLTLWNPLGFCGMPFAANPQFGSFYPLNFIFFIHPIEKALTIYIIAHYLLVGCFGFLLLREFGFSKEASVLGSVAYCFSGVFSSLSNLIVLLSVASWLQVSGWLVVRSLKQRWLPNVLWLSLVFALQNFGGDPQTFADCLLLCVAIGFAFIWKSGKVEKPYLRLFGGIALALGIAAIITMVQNLLTLQMLPLSNRVSGYSYEDFTLWSLAPKNLLTLFFANSYLAPDKWQYVAGFLYPLSFLLGVYPGAAVFMLGFFAYRRGRQSWAIWLGLVVLGLALSLGKYDPFFRIIYVVPFLRGFRIPEKFFLIAGFGLVMLFVEGFEGLAQKPRKKSAAYYLPFLALGATVLAVSLYLHFRGADESAPQTAHDLLLWGSALKSLAIYLLAAGWILAAPRIKKGYALALGVGLLVYLDLAGTHFHLNPTTDSSYYTSAPAVMQDIQQAQLKSVPPLRFATINPGGDVLLSMAVTMTEYYSTLHTWLRSFWGVYYGVDDIFADGSFYVSDIDLFNKIYKTALDQQKIFARCAVPYVYKSDQGLQPIVGALDRAMVFYSAEVIPDRKRLVALWESPSFNEREKILLEKAPESMPANPAMAAEPAQILSYANEKVTLRLNARAPGWLVLFDTYYPGWTATVDGQPAPIARADVFFRAVPVPAGEHTVTFRYLPATFVYGIIISGAGLMAWLALMIFTQLKWKKRSPSGSGSSSSWF